MESWHKEILQNKIMRDKEMENKEKTLRMQWKHLTCTNSVLKEGRGEGNIWRGNSWKIFRTHERY